MLLNLCFLFLTTSCQRKSEDNLSTSIAIQMPATNSSLVTASELEHVVINISGPGMDTLAQTWSKRANGFGLSNSLPTFSFDVPQGTDRLIQALAVYKNATTGSMDFYYGEVIQSLSVSDLAVTVPISQVGISSGSEGQISGRYIGAGSYTPTGTLSVSFTPAGRNSMIIMQSPIIEGWFNTFTIEGQEFDYTVNGTSIFSGPKSLAYFLTHTSNQIMAIKVPEYYYTRVAGMPPEKSDARIEIRGFFGDGVVTAAGGTEQKVCYKNSNMTLQGYVTRSWYLSNPSYPFIADTPNVSYVSYSPTGAFTKTGSLATISGGYGYVSAACGSSINAWTSQFLKLDPNFPNYPTNPSYPYFLSHIKGGIQSTMMSSYPTVTSLPTQLDYDLYWSFMPGLTPSDYSSFVVAMTEDAYNYLAQDGHDSIDCDKMNSNLDANGEIYVAGDLKVKKLTTTTAQTAVIHYASVSQFTSPMFFICPKNISTGTFLPGAEVRK